jgi:hypothetical protein
MALLDSAHGRRRRLFVGTDTGIGTQFRGWQHNPDGTSTATSWFVVLFVPLVPLRRYRIRVLTETSRETFLSHQPDRYEILENTGLVWSELVSTWWQAFRAVIVLLVPLGLMWTAHGVHTSRKELGLPPSFAWQVIGGASWLLILLALPILLLRGLRAGRR